MCDELEVGVGGLGGLGGLGGFIDGFQTGVIFDQRSLGNSILLAQYRVLFAMLIKNTQLLNPFVGNHGSAQRLTPFVGNHGSSQCLIPFVGDYGSAQRLIHSLVTMVLLSA
ncbi:hypothetical protein MNBD_GAMMA12-530 [hydrothermal vent metagenome]|uniref:Uncharacterized protein n=1 Tax=hydrothermal vent metagenome TaxID=652676 RepID=A0A3B0Y9T6_9ZZZZ